MDRIYTYIGLNTRGVFDFSATVGLSLWLEALSWAEYPTLTDCPTDQKQFDNNRAPGIVYSSGVLSVNVLSNLILEKKLILKKCRLRYFRIRGTTYRQKFIEKKKNIFPKKKKKIIHTHIIMFNDTTLLHVSRSELVNYILSP